MTLDIPSAVQHNFLFAFDLSANALNGGKCYRCSYCGQWTQDPEATEAKGSVCQQRDRRQGQRRRSLDRRR